MPVIELETLIRAPIERCFDLSLSVDVHKASADQTGEHIVDGVRRGLMKLGDSVTWRARHFGVTQDLRSHIPVFDRPRYFVSEMTKGAFKRMYHEHIFEERNGRTLMRDRFDFEAPFGLLGKLVSRVILKPYMRRFLEKRNQTLKVVAESDEWRKYIAE